FPWRRFPRSRPVSAAPNAARPWTSRRARKRASTSRSRAAAGEPSIRRRPRPRGLSPSRHRQRRRRDRLSPRRRRPSRLVRRPPQPAAPRSAPPALEPPPGDPTPTPSKSYRVEKTGFENDVYDRRSMRNLIRSGGLLENDSVAVDTDPARRASDIPELKSLFDLKKSSRVQPPAVCRKHTDRVAHYVCAGTERPLCEECAEEKKFGGASVRVCDHCGGTVNELTVAEEP